MAARQLGSEHLNAWIGEASRLNGSEYRATFVTDVPTRLRFPFINSDRVFLTNLLRNIDDTGDNWIKGPNDEVDCSRRLKVILSGWWDRTHHAATDSCGSWLVS
jgi:hypothetical protein